MCYCVQLMGLISVRKLLDYFYTQQDLYWLDHLLPEDDRRKAEDEGNKLECGVQLIAPPKRPVTVLNCHHYIIITITILFAQKAICQSSVKFRRCFVRLHFPNIFC